MPTVPRWKSRMHTHVEVGRQVLDFRGRFGLTRRTVAGSVGCHPSSIGRLERGLGGSLQLVEAVLWALGLDLSSLQSRTVTKVRRPLRGR